mmetsp:Transcript_38714/g.58885  ORF Transcript_38714/g.58885 Transcript_38714/m.58885 type:complete len:102 (-) Transcript_38714:35-340(-)
MKTRQVKSIISHGQKFLVRLVSFLEQNEKIEEMTQEDVEYFHGILSKKTHWMKRFKHEKDELKKVGHLFQTTRHHRRHPPKQPLPPIIHRTPSSEHHTCFN